VKGVVAIPKATMEWFGNMLFHSKTSSGHDIFFDSNESEGGKNSAPRPKEMLLYSLMACTGMDVVAILRKMKALEELESFRMEVEYEMTREHPRIFKKIILMYFFKFRGDPRDKVEVFQKSGQEWQKYEIRVRKNKTKTYHIHVAEKELNKCHHHCHIFPVRCNISR